MHGARLIARVDDRVEEVYLKGLNHDTNYGVSTNLPSVVLVGGEYMDMRMCKCVCVWVLRMYFAWQRVRDVDVNCLCIEVRHFE